MKNTSRLLPLLFSCVFLLASTAITRGDDTDLDNEVMQGTGDIDLPTLQNNLEKREEPINLLTEQGLVGITNEGLYSVRGKIAPMQTKLIREQNADLKAYYQLAAKQNGEDVETVQKKSAARMIKDAGPEVWVQDEEGDWYQK